MYNLERISKIIADVEMYFKDLREMKITGISSIKKERFYSLSMVLFAIINRVIDLGDEIVKANKFGAPASYKEIFQLLEKRGVISNDLQKKMGYLASKRNVLAHEYFNVTTESVYEIFLGINSVNTFVDAVKKFIKKK